MTRQPKKIEVKLVEIEPVSLDNFTHGAYQVTKPHGSYVVRLGGSVIYANPDLTQVQKYLDIVSPVK